MKNGMIRIGMFEAYLERMLIRGLKVAYISYFTRTLQEAKANATKEERAVANEQIIETAFMQYTNTILDSLDAPERVDQIAYQQAVEDRLREDERGRMEKYLRSKHLLF